MGGAVGAPEEELMVSSLSLTLSLTLSLFVYKSNCILFPVTDIKEGLVASQGTFK